MRTTQTFLKGGPSRYCTTLLCNIGEQNNAGLLLPIVQYSPSQIICHSLIHMSSFYKILIALGIHWITSRLVLLTKFKLRNAIKSSYKIFYWMYSFHFIRSILHIIKNQFINCQYPILGNQNLLDFVKNAYMVSNIV